MKKSSALSEFVRNASPEEKKRVYDKVMKKATQRQKVVIKAAARKKS